MYSEINSRIIDLINGNSKDPHALLGMHIENNKIVVRVFNVHSKSIVVKDIHTGKTYEMNRIIDEGLFECVITDRDTPFKYELIHTTKDGHTYSVIDPYCFWPTISDYDLYLFNQGNNHRIYEKMGCHLCEVEGVKGASFCVWAPSAKRVSVVGSFNQWDGRIHPMRMMGSSGVWELFIPGLTKGDLYKYEIKTPTDEIYIKSDPYAFYDETPPHTASVVYDLDNYEWQDSGWMEKRANESVFDKPVNIYEVHLGSWRQEPDDESEKIGRAHV